MQNPSWRLRGFSTVFEAWTHRRGRGRPGGKGTGRDVGGRSSPPLLQRLHWLRPTLRALREIGFILAAYAAYLLAKRLLPAHAGSLAVGNALQLLSLEEAGGFLWEHHLQAWALEAGRGGVLFFNGVYLLAFWPFMAPVAVLVYIKSRERYRYYRTVILLSLALAIPVFVAFPVAPPRLLPSSVDGLQAFGPSAYGGPGMTPFYNPLAAMPSFHFAWAILFGLLFFRSGPAWLKALGLLYPALHFLAIIVTGNHYILDAAGGFTVALASVLLYEIFLRRQALALWLRRLLLASRAIRRVSLRKRVLGAPIKAP